MELNINDKLIFEPILTGAIPGKYILNFSIILKESNYTDSFSDLIKYYGNTNSSDYEPKIFIGNVLKLIFIVECKDECKTCNQLNIDSNSFCVKCKDEFPYFFNEKSECKSECNNIILIKGDMKYCINNCAGNNTYVETDGNIYCRGNCENDQLIYKENDTFNCYDKCKERQFIYEIGNEKYCIDNCESNQYVYENEIGETYCYDNCKDNQFIITKNDENFCIDYCDIDKFVYINEENKKYCFDEYDTDKFLYIGEDNVKYYYDNCKSNQFIIENENEKYCIDNCDNNKYVYINNNNDKYCIDEFDNEKFIYIGEDDVKYCYDNCKNDQVMYIKSVNEKYCLSSCLDSNENLYLDKDRKKCYKNCSEASDFKIYVYEHECVSECPQYYYVNSDNICVSKNDENKVFGLTDAIKLIEGLSETISSSDTKSKVEIYVVDNTIISCYSTKTDLNDLIKSNSNLTFISNFKECEKLIKKEYELDEDSELYIIAIELHSKSSNKVINDYEYEIFIKEGKTLNSSICDNIDIEISSPINNIDLINLEKASILAEQGYDIYNLSSDFYYDYCLAAYINNNDLTLDVREEDIYPSNVTFIIYNNARLLSPFFYLCPFSYDIHEISNIFDNYQIDNKKEIKKRCNNRRCFFNNELKINNYYIYYYICNFKTKDKEIKCTELMDSGGVLII